MEQLFQTSNQSMDDPKFKMIEDNIKRIREDIANTAVLCGRKSEEIRLMAVTKTVEPKYINHAIKYGGIDLIGENRVQEFLMKKPELKLDNVECHLIGTLQSNKVKKIVGQVDMIQSVNSFKLAQEIDRCCNNAGIKADILIEINIGDEDSKTGLDATRLDELLHQIDELTAVEVKGLMAIPPKTDDKKEISAFFHNMFKLFIDNKAKKYHNSNMQILSMGMSHDYKQAIIEGATLIRPGSAIFGNRQY